MSVVSVRNVAKSFRIPAPDRQTVRENLLGFLRPRATQEMRALDGISFTVEKGSAVGILGRNGSGKTTLMRILAGIYLPDRGAVEIAAPDTPILGLGVGWNEELDAIDNVCLLGTVLGFSLAELRAGMDEILEFAELERFATTPLRQYSSGMKVRLAYAVAFRSVSDILLLDEVFAVGDAGFKKRCRQRCETFKAAGHTTLLVSHDPDEVRSFCERGILLENGKIMVDDTADRAVEAYLALLDGAPRRA